jgi:WD40 repeat protein
VALTTDESHALAATVQGKKGAVHIIDTHELRSTQILEGPVTDAAFCDATLIISTADGGVLNWDLREKNPATLFTAEKSVRCVAVESKQRWCACGVGADIHVYDKVAGKRLCVHDEAHSLPLSCLKFRQDELVSSGEDGLLCVLDMDRCLEFNRYDDAALRAVMHTENDVRTFGFVGEGEAIAYTISVTEELGFWSVDKRRPGRCGHFPDLRMDDHLMIEERGGYVVDLFYDSGCAQALCGDMDGGLAMFDVNLEKTQFQVAFRDGYSSVVRVAARLGGSFLTGAEDGFLCLWSPSASGKRKRTE